MNLPQGFTRGYTYNNKQQIINIDTFIYYLYIVSNVCQQERKRTLELNKSVRCFAIKIKHK